jgi:hypothetical protein
MALGADREKGGVMGLSYWPFSKPQAYSTKSDPYAAGAIEFQKLLSQFGNPAQKEGLQNLLKLLQGEGRVDPRLLAQAQAQNSRSTQQQMDAARADAARSGLGGGGLNQALQAALGAAGANRSAGLNYQDIADSYGRNQQNLGLLGSLVTQPQLGYASVSADLYKSKMDADAKLKAARVSALGAGIAAGAGSGAGGCWVAEAIFGVDATETHLARFYVNTMAPGDLHDAYMENGRDLAVMVEHDEDLRGLLRPTFLSFADAAAAVLVN